MVQEIISIVAIIISVVSVFISVYLNKKKTIKENLDNKRMDVYEKSIFYLLDLFEGRNMKDSKVLDNELSHLFALIDLYGTDKLKFLKNQSAQSINNKKLHNRKGKDLSKLYFQLIDEVKSYYDI